MFGMSSFFSGGLKGMLETEVFPWVRRHWGLSIEVQDATLQMFNGAVQIRGITVRWADAAGSPPIVTCPNATFSIGLRELMAGRGLAITDLRSEEIQIDLQPDDWNRLLEKTGGKTLRSVPLEEAMDRITGLGKELRLDRATLPIRLHTASGQGQQAAWTGTLELDQWRLADGGNGDFSIRAAETCGGRFDLSGTLRDGATGDWDLNLELSETEGARLPLPQLGSHTQDFHLDAHAILHCRGRAWSQGSVLRFRVQSPQGETSFERPLEGPRTPPPWAEAWETLKHALRAPD
ncbi:MAG: hypothetical protein ACOX52_08915 [Verrucomicrobiota bacterium]